MNERERRAAKYLPFDSLKGLKEAIDLEDHKSNGKLKLPTITEEEKLQMNLILFECFSKNRAIRLFYLEEGELLEYSGVIKNIDVLNKQITLLPKKKFSIDSIYRLTIK